MVHIVPSVNLEKTFLENIFGKLRGPLVGTMLHAGIGEEVAAGEEEAAGAENDWHAAQAACFHS